MRACRGLLWLLCCATKRIANELNEYLSALSNSNVNQQYEPEGGESTVVALCSCPKQNRTQSFYSFVSEEQDRHAVSMKNRMSSRTCAIRSRDKTKKKCQAAQSSSVLMSFPSSGWRAFRRQVCQRQKTNSQIRSPCFADPPLPGAPTR